MLSENRQTLSFNLIVFFSSDVYTNVIFVYQLVNKSDHLEHGEHLVFFYLLIENFEFYGDETNFQRSGKLFV